MSDEQTPKPDNSPSLSRRYYQEDLPPEVTRAFTSLQTTERHLLEEEVGLFRVAASCLESLQTEIEHQGLSLPIALPALSFAEHLLETATEHGLTTRSVHRFAAAAFVDLEHTCPRPNNTDEGHMFMFITQSPDSLELALRNIRDVFPR